MGRLCVVLLHSTDEPDLAVAGLDAARGAAEAGRPVTLWLASEGARIGAKGVARALSGHGRPDLEAWLATIVARGGRVLVSASSWADRGYAPEALIEGGDVVPAAALSSLVAEGWVCASF